jgi:hypothetical protein
MNANLTWLSEPLILERILNHIDNKTTDLDDTVRKEPVADYLSQQRFDAEIDLLRHLPVVLGLCAMLLDNSSDIAGKPAGVPRLL